MRQLCLIAIAASLVGCIDRPLALVEPNPTTEERIDFPVKQNNNLDLLFVIDNSGSMKAEQISLALNFVNIINTMEASLEGGLPNIHIGVISTDMGNGSHAGCSDIGDGGRLQNTARVPGCSPPSGFFIKNIDGVKNYTGTLADTFACIAQLGTSGCGFEQPLESLRKALDGSNPQNAGFLRDDALLAIVFITDEDDCSAYDTAMFDNTNDPTSTLGARSSFRCFEFGVTCDVGNPRTLGPREVCTPREDSPYMVNVDDYIGFIKSLKAYESQILIAGILGNPTPIAVTTDRNGFPCLQYSCGEATTCGAAQPDETAAVPPVRLKAFMDAFPLNQLTTICNENLSDALQRIADFFIVAFEGHCLQGVPKDVDPNTPGVQTDCVVTETRSPSSATPVETILPRCDNTADAQSSTNLPCYTIAEDAEQCPDTQGNLSVNVFYDENATVPPDTTITARCVTQ